jgi:hypothetical protein
MTEFKLETFTFEELKALEEAIKAVKSTKRDEAKESVKEAKEARVTEFKGNLGEGDTISFLYGRKNETFEGTVVRASEKSVTVQSAVFAENGKKDINYVKYDRVVAILTKAEAKVETTVEEAAEALAM